MIDPILATIKREKQYFLVIKDRSSRQEVVFKKCVVNIAKISGKTLAVELHRGYFTGNILQFTEHLIRQHQWTAAFGKRSSFSN